MGVKLCRCDKRPSFGLPGCKAVCCKQCKTANMVDVNNPRCPCNKAPTYALPGQRACACKQCKTLDMVDVINKRCSCGKYPNYDWPNYKKTPRYCKACKEDGMVDKRHPFCACGTRASYGVTSGKPTHCQTCASYGMVDLTHKKQMCFCGKHRPSYAVASDSKPTHCASCKTTEMISTNKQCPCGTTASFGYAEDKIKRCCAKCRDDDMIQLSGTYCKFEGCMTQVRPHVYDGYCVRCFVHLFPELKTKRAWKIKEQHVADYIQEVAASDFPHLSIVYDRALGGCSSKRPDIFIDALTHCILVEVDENAHRTSAYCSCENKRIMHVFEDAGQRPMVVIRFNPDKYTTNDVTNDTCFGRHPTWDVPIITDKAQWASRLALLKDRVNYYVNNIPDQEVTAEHLYYDGFV